MGHQRGARAGSESSLVDYQCRIVWKAVAGGESLKWLEGNTIIDDRRQKYVLRLPADGHFNVAVASLQALARGLMAAIAVVMEQAQRLIAWILA